MVPITDGGLVAHEVERFGDALASPSRRAPGHCSRTASVGAREDTSPGYRPGMADETEKKKAPLATWIIASVAIGLLVMLAIGIAVL